MTNPAANRETLSEPAHFLFAGCATGAHMCPVRYDGYGGTLICSCACHEEADAGATWDRTMPGDDLTGRTRHCWRVEGWENNEWGQVASASNLLADARRKRGHVAQRVPDMVTRIVRETVTYTVEE
jgi:hypothetical protein